MPYYVTPQTYNHTYNTNYNNYSQHQNWNNNNWHGNGWTAMNWANKWYPGWHAQSYKWKNNCWWVYIKQGHHYRTVCISPNYNWHWYHNGYQW
jgi:hypothetical protein